MVKGIDYFQDPRKDYRESLGPGSLCVAPVPFRDGQRSNIIRLTHLPENNPAEAQYEFEEMRTLDYKPRPGESLRHLRLNADEFLVAVGHKFRPVIIVSDLVPSPQDHDLGRSGFLCVPLYSVSDEAGNLNKNYTRDLIIRAQAYQYSSLFYIPAEQKYGIRESLARIDRIRFCLPDLLDPKPVELTRVALELLRNWTWASMGCPIFDTDFEEYIKQATLDLSSSAPPP